MYGFDSDTNNVVVDLTSFENLKKRLRYNGTVAEFYDEYAEDGGPDNCERKAERMRHCAEVWKVDWHRFLGYKELKNAGLCRDKFCVNCASALALYRENKFTPIFNELAKTNSIYHAVFTVKNCKAIDLRATIERMNVSYYYLLRYLTPTKKGKSRVGEHDFAYLGYNAAVRSLEVTYNKEHDTYHPHFHCLMSLSPNLDLKKRIRNVFSYSYQHDEVKEFSSDEVLFQKIWYLLNNRIEVNAKNIDELEQGYSVMFNKANPENYKEIFKYPFKEDLNKDRCLDYERFKVYYKALKDLHVVQGYGAYKNFKFSDEDLTSTERDIAYREWKLKLDREDPPVEISENVDTIVDNIKNHRYVYTTASSVKRNIFDERLTEESKDVLKGFGNVVDKKG